MFHYQSCKPLTEEFTEKYSPLLSSYETKICMRAVLCQLHYDKPILDFLVTKGQHIQSNKSSRTHARGSHLQALPLTLECCAVLKNALTLIVLVNKGHFWSFPQGTMASKKCTTYLSCAH